MTRWGPAILGSLALWVSVPFARAWVVALQQRGWLNASLFLLGGLGVGAFAYIARNSWRQWSRGRWLALVAILAVYVVLMKWGVVTPAERIHFLQVTFLAYLFYRACKRPPLAGGLAALVGIIEEVIQIFVPTRFFDWRDIGMNLAAGVLSSALLSML